MGTTTRIKPKGKPKAKQAAAFDRDQAIALAQAVSGSRQQFADTFRSAQAGRLDPLEFEAVADGAADKVSAFTRAFLRAAELGWLVDLILGCLNARIAGHPFLAAAVGISDDKRLAAVLQKISDPNRGIQDAGLFLDRLPRAMRQVCRIDIDGQARGTGFLIRPDLVMTAYHVIKPLLELDNTPSPGSAAKLTVRFGFSRKQGPNGVVSQVDGTPYRVADAWLVATSPCTDDEILDQLPADEEKLNDFWDFAVIGLAEAPGVARGGLEVGDLPVKKGYRLTILQHPKGEAVAMDTSTVRGFLGTGGFRIVHAVNTEDGSSGGPCLNDDFKVVGLHQGAMPDGPRKKKDERQNRAVPMPRILGAWDLKNLPPPAVSIARILAVDTNDVPQHPVFGRFKLQEWVARSSTGGTDAGGTIRDRFLVVGGPKGAGKSFTLDVLGAMLPAGEHSVLGHKASDFSSETTALGFARKYLLSPLGAGAAALPSLGHADTSDNAWLNREVIGDLLNVMDQSRNKRMVWVVLDELDEVVLPDQGQVRKLLDLLYSRAEKTPWLRFVLLGLEAVPVPDTASFTERDFPAPATEAALATDVGDYLMRLLDARKVSQEEKGVRATAASIVRLCVKASGKLDAPGLLAMVAEETVAVEKDYGLRP